jgi:peptidoglycan/xylan/chitin deacetylase (PgdA/CDA1 family)
VIPTAGSVSEKRWCARAFPAVVLAALLFGCEVPRAYWELSSNAVAGPKSGVFDAGASHAPSPQREVGGSAPAAKTPAASPVCAGVVSHGLRTKRKVALTFDACPTQHPGRFDEGITRILVETKTPATVFLSGLWIQDAEQHARYLASLPGFEIGNHSYSHPHLGQISDERVRDELQRTQQMLFDVTGKRAALFRPPYGECDERVVKLAAEMGLTTIEFDLPSGDPDRHATKEKLVEYVTSMARNGSIIVMHINQRGWHTAEALPDIITILRRRGFKLVTVGEILADLKRAG